MARFVFWLTVFAILTIIPILVESESEENPKQQTPGDDVTVYNADNVVHLIMNPKNMNAHCDSESKICGTNMCVSETKGNTENIEIGSQSSIRDTNKNQVPYEDKKCFCSNDEAVLFVRQEVLEVEDIVKYRVQEVTESGCKAVVCDWKLTVFTRIPYEYDRNLDVIGCMSSSTCMVVCDVRKSKLLQDEYNFMFLASMVLPSIMSVILYFSLKHCMRNSPKQATKQPTLSVDEAFDLAAEYEDIRHYSLMYDKFPGRHNLRPRMRL